jgi:glycosyltransferase involved in cell wall biosynthesis
MNQCDVFVLASRRESFPLALLEASEAGCAIVATDVDGASEALDGGAAGLLVPPEDPRALAAAIDRLLNEPQAAMAFRTNARASVERFSVEKMARETLEAYAKILLAKKT